jgi:hypothetical protein
MASPPKVLISRADYQIGGGVALGLASLFEEDGRVLAPFKEAWLTRFPCRPATLELLALVVGCVKRDQPRWPLPR